MGAAAVETSREGHETATGFGAGAVLAPLRRGDVLDQRQEQLPVERGVWPRPGARGSAAAQVRRVPEGHGLAGVPRHRGERAGREAAARRPSRHQHHCHSQRCRLTVICQFSLGL